MQTGTKFLIGSILLAGAVGYLMFTSVQQTSMYYVTIEEFLAQKAAFADEGLRIAGRVKSGTVQRNMTRDGEELKFEIGDFVGEEEMGPTIPVYYVGVTPDMFKDEGGSDVIIEGRFENGRLEAQTVMTSCPSKYEAEDEYGQAAPAEDS